LRVRPWAATDCANEHESENKRFVFAHFAFIRGPR
jgi:hypothetical protein